MLQVRKRLQAFKKRRSRFKMLRRAGVRTDRVIRTGGVSFITYGQRSLGVSDFVLLEQRRAVAAACCGQPGGANLDLSLAISMDFQDFP